MSVAVTTTPPEVRDLVASVVQARIERGLIAPLSRWCRNNEALIQFTALRMPLDGAITIYVSRRDAAFDFVLAAEISRLELDELELALSVDVIQVPTLNSPEAVQTFLSTYHAVLFYGDSGSSSATGEPPSGVPAFA